MRPKISVKKQARNITSIRLIDEQEKKLKKLGGAKWVRAVIDVTVV